MPDLYLIIILVSSFGFGKAKIIDLSTQVLNYRSSLQDEHFWRAYMWNFKGTTEATMIKLVSNYSLLLVEEFVSIMLRSHMKVDYSNLSIFITRFRLTYSGTPELPKRHSDTHCANSSNVEDVQYFDFQSPNLKVEENTLKKRMRTFSGDKNYAFQIIVWDIEDLLAAAENAPNYLFPNPRGIYMVTFISSFDVPLSMIHNALKYIWTDFGVLNIVFHLPFSCKQKNLYMYDPFHWNGGKWGTIKAFQIADAEANDEEYRNSLYNLNGYPLKVSVFDRLPTILPYVPPNLQDNRLYRNLTYSKGYSGTDGMMMGLLAEKINFDPIIIANDTDYGFELNGTYFGTLGLVSYRKVDISFNSRFANGFAEEVVEYLTPIINDRFCLVVPKARKIPESLSLFRCFDLYSWLLMLFTYVIASVYWYIVQPADFTGIRRKHPKGIFDSFLEIFCVFISVPISLASTANHRMFLLACMVFNIIFIGAFQGQLVTSFSQQSYYPDIDTLEDFDKSGLHIETPTYSTLSLFSSDTTELITKVSKKMYLGKRRGLIKIIGNGAKIATFERRFDAWLRMVLADCEDRVHIVSECPMSYFFTYIVPRGSPYTHVFNIVMVMVREAGLVTKWSKDISDSLLLTARMHRAPDYENPQFTLDNLQIAFYFLIFGLLVCTIAFIVELYSVRSTK